MFGKDALIFRGDLQNETNLDGLMSEGHRGIWRLLPSRNYFSLPADFNKKKAGCLIIYANGSHMIQELRNYDGEGKGSMKTWTRHKFDDIFTSFTEWVSSTSIIDSRVSSKALLMKSVTHEDLDELYSPGIYSVLSFDVPNWPFDERGIVSVLNGVSDSVGPVAFGLAQIAITTDQMAFRLYTPTGFSEWKLLG